MRTLLALAVLAPSLAAAQVPSRLTYQGRLLNADGAPTTGVVQVTFKIFDAATSGTQLWSEDQSLALTDGYYATFLGDATPAGCSGACTGINPSIFTGQDLFLEMSVGVTALSPRQRLASVPYAVVSGTTIGGIQNQVGADQTASFRLSGRGVISAPSVFTGTGTAGTTNGSATVAGTGTAFSTQVMVGDTITVNGESHRVTAIASKTSLTTEAVWSQTTAGLVFTVKPIAMIVNGPAVVGGLLTTTNQPAFEAKLCSSTVNPGDVITWETALTNVGGAYNPATGVFTAPVSGTYAFGFNLLPPFASGGEFRFAFWKNGGLYDCIIQQKAATTWSTAQGSLVTHLNAGETLSIMYSFGTGALYLDCAYNRFWGHLLG